MKKQFLLLVLMTGLALGQHLQAQCVAPGTTIYAFFYNGDRYEIVQENLNWVDAAACAVARGGRLAEINSQQEQDSIFYHINQAGITPSQTVAPDGGGASYLWIGGNDIGTEGMWIWDGQNTGSGPQFWQGTTTGMAVGGLYNNWGNEPDDFNGQDGLGIALTNWPLGVAGQWNDVDDSNTLYYIIENADSVVGIEDPKAQFSLQVVPNPGQNRVAVSLPDGIWADETALLQVYDVQGMLIRELAVEGQRMEITLDELANGLYHLRLLNAGAVQGSGKFVVAR